MIEVTVQLENFENATERLKSALEYDPLELDIVMDAAIRRFEFTFETAWKSVKLAAKAVGYDCKSPKGRLTGIPDGMDQRRGKMAGTSRSEKPAITYLRSGDGYGCVRNGKRELSSIRESIKRIERRGRVRVKVTREDAICMRLKL